MARSSDFATGRFIVRETRLALPGGSLSLSYDPNGNLTSDGTALYAWDARNRLVALTGPTPASFRYDVFGRRTTKDIDEGGR